MAATGVLSAAKRRYPTSEVRGRSQEHPMPEGQRPRGVTPLRRSGAASGRTPCQKSSTQEELPHVGGQRQQPRVPGCDSAGTAERSYPSPRPGVAVERSYPAPEARGSDLEEQPQVQGAVTVLVQEGLEELSHVEGQEGQW